MSANLAYVMFKVSSGTKREVAQKLIEFEKVVEQMLSSESTAFSPNC